MMMQTKNIPPKHVNTKGSVGGRKRSGYHVMMMQTEHTNIPPKHVNAKGSVGGRKWISCNDDANRTYKHTR